MYVDFTGASYAYDKPPGLTAEQEMYIATQRKIIRRVIIVAGICVSIPVIAGLIYAGPAVIQHWRGN